MKVKISRSTLLDGLKKVQSAANAKNIVPIYGFVKMEAGEGTLALTTTDGDISIHTVLQAEVSEPGLATAPIRKFLPTVAGMVEGDVVIDADKKGVRMRGGSFKANFSTLPAENFPTFPSSDAVFSFKVKADEFADMLRKTSFAQSTDTTRAVLTSVLVHLKDGRLRCVATDGRRLALVERELEGADQAEDRQLVIPARAVGIIQHFLDGDGEVTVQSLGSQVYFSFEGGKNRLYTRLLDCAYPNYTTVIPQVYMYSVAIDRCDFISAIERVSAMDSNDGRNIKLTFDQGMLLLEIKSDDACDARDEIPVKYDGEKVEILFNPRYILDPLRSSCEDEISFDFINAVSPASIKSDAEGYFCLLMPMRSNKV